MDSFSSVNWLAVGSGVIAAFLMGWLWYSPKLFGIKWAAGSGVSLDNASKMPVFAMLAQLLALLFLALVIGITASNNTLIIAVCAVLACAVFVASSAGFVNKNRYAITVDFFYVVMAGGVMIACQGIF